MKIYVFAILLIGFMITSCSFGTIKGEGEPQKFQRNIKDFTKVNLSTSANVFIIQGSEFAFTIETNPNIEDLIKTEVDDQELKISSNKNFNASRLDIYITMPHIEKLSANGSGDISCKNEIQPINLELNIKGSGNIILNKIIVVDLKASIAGSGSITLNTGRAKNAFYQISGSGNIEADHVDSESIDASINGSGDILCYAQDKLNVDIFGSGNLKYKGQPKTKVNINGSGKVSSF
jgi:hypothetical protein